MCSAGPNVLGVHMFIWVLTIFWGVTTVIIASIFAAKYTNMLPVNGVYRVKRRQKYDSVEQMK